MDSNNNKIVLGLDVSTKTIGVCVLVDDGSDYGKIAELTHISPTAPSKAAPIESLFIKKKVFADFLQKFKHYHIDKVVIEEPLLSSNNKNTVATLLRFNGMVSDVIYNTLGIVPDYISSYEAREFSFPFLMAIRKYGKDGKQYKYSKILKEIKDARLVLFGAYPWTIDKKEEIQQNVSNLFPAITWQYNKKGELKKENFDATDAYVACLGQIKKERNGPLKFTVSNIKENPDSITYDIHYWGITETRTTYWSPEEDNDE